MTHMTPREEIGYGLDALVIFRSLQQDPVLRALMQFCHTDKENTPAQIRFYSAMVSALYERADDLTGYLEQIGLEHENVHEMPRRCQRRNFPQYGNLSAYGTETPEPDCNADPCHDSGRNADQHSPASMADPQDRPGCSVHPARGRN